MSRLDLTRFLRCTPCFFDLRGITLNSKDVPCRIKVGAKRVLDVFIKPEDFALDFWSICNQQPMYLSNHPVPAEYDQDGILFFDAVAFLKTHADKEYMTCSAEEYKRAKKELLRPRFVKVTPYGVATHEIDWSDLMPLVYSYVYPAPGALTICGKNVRWFKWESCDDADAAGGRNVLPQIEKLLSGRHDLSREDVMNALEEANHLNYNFISIVTDTASYNMYGLWDYSSSVDLPRHYYYFTPDDYSSSILNDMCLTLMSCTGDKEIEACIARMQKDGLIAHSFLDE